MYITYPHLANAGILGWKLSLSESLQVTHGNTNLSGTDLYLPEGRQAGKPDVKSEK